MKNLLLTATLVSLGLLLTVSCTPRRIDLNDIREYTLVRTFDGRLNPADGPVHAEVYVLDRRPFTKFDDPILSNIIEVSSENGGVSRFMFPREEPLGAGVVEIVDLDGDGWFEFLFVRGTHARVVSYENGSLGYRPNKDALFARDSIRFFHRGGRVQLITGGPPIILLGDADDLPAGVEVVKWTKADGFSRSLCCP